MKIKFKSSAGTSDFYLIINKQLDYILSEQRAQRSDLATLTRMLNSLINTVGLKRQSDSYYDSKLDDYRHTFTPTSPQTDPLEQNGD